MLRFDAVPQPVRELLVRLGTHPALLDFALGGGISLALRFGHCWSVDLDFFTTTEFRPEELLEKLQLQNATVISLARNSLSVQAGGVKIDFLRYAYTKLEPDQEIDGVTLVSLPDIAAMKLKALYNRGSKKDFFDFVELLNHFTVAQMLGFFAGKYPSTDVFTVIRSMGWFDDAELDPDPISLTKLRWKDVMAVSKQTVAKL